MPLSFNAQVIVGGNHADFAVILQNSDDQQNIGTLYLIGVPVRILDYFCRHIIAIVRV
jgi:hypothetical protein